MSDIAVVRATAGSGGNPIGPPGYWTGPSEIVAGLKAGCSNIDDVTDNDMMKMKCSRFCTIADPKVIALARAVVSCVPTPLSEDGGPDISRDRGRRERCSTGGAGFPGVDDARHDRRRDPPCSGCLRLGRWNRLQFGVFARSALTRKLGVRTPK
jgi:hypothetical protein